MPTCLSVIPNLRSKRSKLLLINLLFPLFLFSQTSLTGLWTGVFSNDSNTIRKEQSFEIVLTEYRGKVYGYSRSEFIVNDTLYYIVKRVKGTINGDVCEVKDDEIVAFNFPGRLDKGVKVTSSFYRNKVDSTWHLAGNWKTNQTKQFYSVTGKIDLAEEKDLTASKLFPHLEELNLTKDIAFYQQKKTPRDVVMKTLEPEEKLFSSIRNEQQVSLNQPATSSGLVNAVVVNTVDVKTTAAIRTNAETKKSAAVEIPVKTEVPQIVAQVNAEPQKEGTSIQTEELKTNPETANTNPSAETVKVNTATVKQVQAIRTNAELKKSEGSIIPVKTEPDEINAQVKVAAAREKTSIKNEEQKNVQTLAQNTSTKPAADAVKVNTVKTNAVKPVGTTPELKKSTAAEVPVKTSVTNSKPAVIPAVKPVEQKQEIVKANIPVKPIEEIIAPAKTIGGRNSEFAQTVNFTSDSLVLSLYDNGEIDGDTVSLFMNGVPLLSKQGLKASAIKKTIYVTPGNEEFTLVLFAENLGKYPPNTGLLVVRDGEDVYNVRFSADYQKNAGVVFRRKQE